MRPWCPPYCVWASCQSILFWCADLLALNFYPLVNGQSRIRSLLLCPSQNLVRVCLIGRLAPSWPIPMLNGAEPVTRWGPLLLHHELLNPISTWAGEVWTNGVTMWCVRWYILWITQGENWGLIHLYSDYQGMDYREMCELVSCIIAGGSHVTLMCLIDTDNKKFALLYTSADYKATGYHRVSFSSVGYFLIISAGQKTAAWLSWKWVGQVIIYQPYRPLHALDG